MMIAPTPTKNATLPHVACRFETLTDGLDYAARGETGYNYYSVRGELVLALPYAELRERSVALARRLVGMGLEKGARVGLIADTSAAFHTFFFGCQYAGLIPVPLPLPVNLGGRESYVRQLRRMLESADAAMAVAPAELVAMLQEAAGDFIPHIGGPDDFADQPETGALRIPGKDDPCYIQYSSGSTSAPKGVLVTQRSALANTGAISRYGLMLAPGDRCISWLPLYHDMGLVGFCFTPMLNQITIDYMSTMDFARRPLAWLQLIARNRGTVAFSPSFGYDLCARRAANGAAADLDLSSWRVAGIGGDMVRADVLDRFVETFGGNGFRRSTFVPSYGLAESTLAVTFAPLSEDFRTDTIDREALATSGEAVPVGPEAGEDGRTFVVCGSVMSGHALRIVGDSGEPRADRQVGRVLIKGPSLMSGYFRNAEATAAAFATEGWLDTGDLGYMVDGELVITGRSKDLIISNGRNIWPQDIEWSVERLPGLRQGDAAAFSVVDTDGDEAVIVVVQCRLSEPAARDRLRRQIHAMVRDSVGIDANIVLAPPHSLPHTSSGKLSRAGTRANFLAGAYTPAHRDAGLKLAAEG